MVRKRKSGKAKPVDAATLAVDAAIQQRENELRERIWRYRLSGASPRIIANAQDVKVDVATVNKYIKEVVDSLIKSNKELIEEHLLLTIQRYEEIMLKFHALAFGNAKEGIPPDYDAMDVYLNALAAIRAMLNLDKKPLEDCLSGNDMDGDAHRPIIVFQNIERPKEISVQAQTATPVAEIAAPANKATANDENNDKSQVPTNL